MKSIFKERKGQPKRVDSKRNFNSSETVKYQIPSRSLVPFLLITFGIAWSILGLYICLPEEMTGIFGEISGDHPLFFLSVYAPAIAAFTIILYKTGIKGFKGFLSRMLIWRTSLSWYLFLFLGFL
jgi:uncharacterized protein